VNKRYIFSKENKRVYSFLVGGELEGDVLSGESLVNGGEGFQLVFKVVLILAVQEPVIGGEKYVLNNERKRNRGKGGSPIGRR
jgi:hypothetical protein